MAKARGRGRDELVLSPSDGASVRGTSRATPKAPRAVPQSGPSQAEVNTLMRQMGWRTSNTVASDIARSFASERSSGAASGARTTTTLGPGAIREQVVRAGGKGGPIRKGRGGGGRG